MTETFIDTSFVIAVVNRKDQYHEEAMKLSDLYDGQPLVTTEAVLLEIGNALAKPWCQVVRCLLGSTFRTVGLMPSLCYTH